MRLLHEGRRLFERLARLARWPTMEQWQHAPQFLSVREKNIIAAASVVALVALGGVLWQTRTLLTITVPARGGDLTEGLVGQPQYINPLFAATDTDRTLTALIFLPLCDVDGNGAPALASSCARDDQGRYVVNLEQRAWHDGEPITSDDVVFTFDLMRDKRVGSPWRAIADRVTVGRDGPRRAIITLSNTPADAPLVLSQRILPAHQWRAVPVAALRTHELNRRPVGSGPFAVQTIIAGTDGTIRRMVCAAFTDFIPQRSYLNTLTFLFGDTDDEVTNFFRARQIDAFLMVDPTHAKDGAKQNSSPHKIRPVVTVSLFLNTRAHAAFKQKNVRTAIARAINRTAIITDALNGAGVALRVPFPPELLRAAGAQQPSFDPKPISELHETSITLVTPSAPIFSAVARTIQKQLDEVGVSTTVQVIDPATDPESLLKAPLVLMGQDYDADGAQAHWHSQASGIGGTNFSRYQIKEVDDTLQALAREQRPERRAALLKKISDRLVADVPAVFLYQPIYTYYVASEYIGISMERITDLTERFEHVADWYIKKKRVW